MLTVKNYVFTAVVSSTHCYAPLLTPGWSWMIIVLFAVYYSYVQVATSKSKNTQKESLVDHVIYRAIK